MAAGGASGRPSCTSVSRYYEFFEDAFLDWLEEHAGGHGLQVRERVDFVIVASGCEYHRPARLDDELSIEEMRAEEFGRALLVVRFTVRHGADVLAVGRARYVCVRDGAAVSLPAALGA